MRDTRYTFESGWYSVADGILPQKFQQVIVVAWNRLDVRRDGLRVVSQPTVTKREYWGQDTRTGRHMWSGKSAVSHWMPLPDLPDGVNDQSVELLSGVTFK